MLLQFIFYFMLLFICLPMLVVKFDNEDSGWSDKFFICLIHSTLFFILTIHLLAFAKLYETISLFSITLVALIVAVQVHRSRKTETIGTVILTTVWDLTDNDKNWKLYRQMIVNNTKSYMTIRFLSVLDLFRTHWFWYIGILATLIFAAYTRFKHSLTSLYFGSADPYVHIQLAKFLGENTLFAENKYPLGYASVISAMNKLFNLDPYYIVRFIGPLSGFLIILSIYHIMKRVIGAPYSIILSSIFIYSVYAGLPTSLWRQISALSMEYAAIFMLPGIAYCIEYFQKRKMLYLILSGECLAITVLIHVYTASALGVAIVVICLFYWKTTFRPTVLSRISTVMVTAGLVGLLPLIYAFLFGAEDEIAYVTESLQPAHYVGFTEWWNVYINSDQIILVIVSAALLYLLYLAIKTCIYYLRKFPNNSPHAMSALLLIFIIFYFIYESENYGLPTAITADRFGVFFSIICTVASSVILYMIVHLFKTVRLQAIIGSLLAIAIISGVLLTDKIHSPPVGSQYQYNESVQAYLQIKREFQPKKWTIISPVEEYHLAYSFGRHTQLWAFVDMIENPNGKKLEIETDDVFLFIEKVPLGSDSPINLQDAKAIFPIFTGSNLTEFYYRDLENRRIIQAKAWNWINEQLHREEVSIYYDNANFTVYRIHQDGANPPNLLSW